MTVIKKTTGSGGTEDFFKPEKSSIIKKGEADLEPSKQSIVPSSEEAVKKLEERKKKIEGMFETTSLSPEEKSKIIEEALAEAERIKATAREEAKEEITKSIGAAKLLAQSKATEAYQHGFAEGKKEGLVAGKDEVKDIILQAQATLEQTLIERENVLSNIDKEVANLTLECVREILAEEIKTNPQVVLNVARNALEKAKGREEITVFVNPDDKPVVEKNTKMFAGFVKDLDQLKIKTDSSIERGGCLVRTDLGTVDARVSTQFDALKLAFEQISQEENS